MVSNFSFSYPTNIVFGQKSINHLPSLLKNISVNKVLLVYGKGSIKVNGIYDSVIKKLKKTPIKVVEYGGCEPNPDSIFVNKGASLAIKEKVDFILAAGGGSVIDASKAIALLSKNDYHEGIWPYMLLKKNSTNKALPIGVVLTAFGTGSEGNGSFVISNRGTSDKRGLSDLSTRPVFAICDPTYTFSLTSWQIACACADIISHLLEQYFYLEEGNYLSDYLIVGAAKNVIFHSRQIIANPKNLESRENLIMASSFALSYVLSLGKTIDWSVHKIEHAVSGVYQVNHGAGLSCLFPAWLRLVSRNQILSKKIIKLGIELEIISKSMPRQEKINQTIAYFEDFFVSLGLPVRLSKLIKAKPNINKIAQIALGDGKIGKIFVINSKRCRKMLELAQ